ncbi:MAG: hypothetical protein KGJ30_07500 [Burkholderiales bacterium]|nr:hypothetical protein [Burkholderiales bacterium]MDE2158751.1 hypothetical protein [Burkholderiales bacterium]
MPETPAQRALTASTLALAVALLALASFLPPLLASTLQSVLRIVVTALALAVGLVLHWVFLAVAAGRMERGRAGWVGLSAALFPIGSVAALILLNWYTHESGEAAPALRHG